MSDKAVKTTSVVDEEKKAERSEEIQKSQAEYTGNHHMDKVVVTINQNTKHYKKGQTDTVHPTVALIMEKKGIIDKGWEKNVKAYNAPKVVDGQIAN